MYLSYYYHGIVFLWYYILRSGSGNTDAFVEFMLLQSAWEHHGALIRCVFIIGDAVHSIENLKNKQYDGLDDRMGDIRACLEGHKVGGGLLCSCLNCVDFFL